MAAELLRKVFSILPESLAGPLRAVKESLEAVPYYGTGRWCPVCTRSSRRFRTAGIIPREDAECPHCGAGERHRLLWLYLTKKTDLFDGAPKKMLHVAPERCLQRRFKRAIGDGYLTADLENRRAMVRMDITDIQYPDDSFDVIYCSHVLEHVAEDRKAMREFHRVLRPTGWAVLLVPITADRTFEDPTVVSPAERLRLFGQEDHVRRYGPDFVDRLRDVGFEVRIIRVLDVSGKADAIHMGLTAASGEIYHCTKA